MRVVYNGLPAAGAKTGIGHYLVELTRCLRAGGCETTSFVQTRLWRQAKALVAGLRGGRRGPQPGAPPAGPTWRQHLVVRLRAASQALFARRFGSFTRGGGFDLYHEPNFIPL